MLSRSLALMRFKGKAIAGCRTAVPPAGPAVLPLVACRIFLKKAFFPFFQASRLNTPQPWNFFPFPKCAQMPPFKRPLPLRKPSPFPKEKTGGGPPPVFSIYSIFYCIYCNLSQSEHRGGHAEIEHQRNGVDNGGDERARHHGRVKAHLHGEDGPPPWRTARWRPASRRPQVQRPASPCRRAAAWQSWRPPA